MGYNNNNAGIKMIRYNHYGEYDDLKYYDELVLKNAQKNKKIERKQSNENTEHYTEKNISSKHFMYSDAIIANIFIISMKKKKDIGEILYQCEKMMENDERTSLSLENRWPMVHYSLLFLSMVAEKLECDVLEFFIDNQSLRKKFVYSLIEYVGNYHSYDTMDTVELYEDGSAEITYLGFDSEYGMSEYDFHNDRPAVSMDLNFQREIENGKVFYSVAFGDFNHFSKRDYMLKGAYLWEETEGKLKEFIEAKIKEYQSLKPYRSFKPIEI